MSPICFQDFIHSEEARRETWRRKIEVDKELVEARPNRGHLAIAELVQRGKVSNVLTQNVDGLHQASGIPEEQLIELHGNTTYARCLDCRVRYELGPIIEAFEKDKTLPVCAHCGGLIKTATISFGQPMPKVEMLQAETTARACDLMLAIGSSLVVYPAAALPAIAKAEGAGLVILNREPTELDGLADLVLNAEIGETLESATGIS